MSDRITATQKKHRNVSWNKVNAWWNIGIGRVVYEIFSQLALEVRPKKHNQIKILKQVKTDRYDVKYSENEERTTMQS